MDMSRQIVNDDLSCIGASMYLSFDSNSTISNTAYKTLEALEDLSTMSVQDVKATSMEQCHQDSTLEAANVSDLHETVKKVEKRTPLNVAGVASNTISKNILQEYKALSSTPTKAQFRQGVHKSDLCVDFQAPLKSFGKSLNENSEENKENAVPEKDVSMSSLAEEMVNSSMLDKKKPFGMDKGVVSSTEEMSLRKLVADSIQNSCDLKAIESNRESELEIARNHHSGTFAHKEQSTTTNPNVIIQNELAEIPEILDKVLQISEKVAKKGEENALPKSDIEKHIPTRGRHSLLPQQQKRTYNLTHRMSIVVKTTLNSPARKIARKSMISTGQSNGLELLKNKPTITSGTSSSRAARRSVMLAGPSRRSMLPISAIPTSSLAFNQLKEGVLKENTKKLDLNLAGSVKESRPKIDEKMRSVLPVQSKDPDIMRSRIGPNTKKDAATFPCDICSRTFLIKSLLEAHKYSHGGDSPPTSSMLRKSSSTDIRANSQHKNATNVVASIIPQCKYCDKKFAIVRALNIHLLEKCSKIPPSDKKKLHLTDLNHVEKAQLPHVFSNPSTKAFSKHQPKQDDSALKSSLLLKGKKEAFAELNSAMEDVKGQITNNAKQTSLTSARKRTPHAGVYRTPSKSIVCHLCKQSFKSILDYTNHSMTLHSTQPNIDA